MKGDLINNRLNILKNHLMVDQNVEKSQVRISKNPTKSVFDDEFVLHATSSNYKTEGHKQSFDIDEMSNIINETSFINTNEELMKVFKDPFLYKKHWNSSKEESRELIAEQVKRLLQSGLFRLEDYKNNPDKFMAAMKCTGYLLPDVTVKLGVQMVLFGGSVYNLGTERHHKKYIHRAESFDLPGCFAMTEIGHGSNVRKLQTTATYDPETKEFIVNTPDDSATKWWLGNAQSHAVIATVFCRLITKGKDYGIHAVLVPIRDEKTHEALSGVEIGDCGDKVGLHGVDNGFLKFHNVRVPRENLLNRFGDVLEDGTYKSDIKSEGKRFAAVLGELTTGRLSLVESSLAQRKLAITIATRYAAARHQFGPTNKPEQPILDYRSHQVRLIPIIASCYASEFAKRVVARKYIEMKTSQKGPESDLTGEVHALTAGMKSIVTWDTQGMLQTCRECCGGHGFSAYNRFGQIREDHDISLTFEGDNTVLVQQTAGYLLKQFGNQFKGSAPVVGMAKYFIKNMGNTIVNRNPAKTRFASIKHLRSFKFQQEAFEFRTAKLVQQIALDLAKNKKKMGFWTAWNDLVPKSKELARAYVEQLILEEFQKEIMEQPEGEIRDILKMLCDVYALDCMDRDVKGFFEILKSNKVRAISRLKEELCEELRVHAVSLVDAFAIPDFAIDSPIGLSQGDYVHNVLKYSKLYNPNNHSFPVSLDQYKKTYKPRQTYNKPHEDHDERENDVLMKYE